MKPDLSIKFGSLDLRNPLFGASGSFGYGDSFDDYFSLEKIGGFVTKGLSLEPTLGNPAPRIVETAAGILNSIGLHNIGIENFIKEKLPKLESVNTLLIVNLFGKTLDEYIKITERVSSLKRVDAIEVNISCPNIKEGGITFGTDLNLTKKLILNLRKITKLPLIIKLSPNVTKISDFAKVAEDEGADGISLVNTFIGMAIDIKSRKPILANIKGGLSGAAIKPLAVSMIWDCYKAVKIPIFGIGGITSAEDVLEFMLAGAKAIQIGTHNFVQPTILSDIADELPKLMKTLGMNSISEIVGTAHRL